MIDVKDTVTGTEVSGRGYFDELEIKPLEPLQIKVGGGEQGSLGATAELVANNEMSVSTEKELGGLKLDGYLIGVGSASIFAMIEAFGECEGMVGVDVHPTPVAVGRMIRRLLVGNENFESWMEVLGDEDRVRMLLKDEGLPAQYMDHAMQSVAQAVQQFRWADSGVMYKKDGMHVENDGVRTLLPLEAIRRNYHKLKGLADNGKMHFVQENFFWPKFWDDMADGVPGIQKKKNLIYPSNAIDHLVRSKVGLWGSWRERGKKQNVVDDQEVLAGVVGYNCRGWDASHFVYTLQSMDYELKLSDRPPKFRFNEDDIFDVS